MSMGSCVGQSSAKSQGNHISIYNTAPCIFGELVESSILYALLQVDCYQYFNVSSVRACVRPCVMDVTSPNEPGLRENTREDCDVIV